MRFGEYPPQGATSHELKAAVDVLQDAPGSASPGAERGGRTGGLGARTDEPPRGDGHQARVIVPPAPATVDGADGVEADRAEACGIEADRVEAERLREGTEADLSARPSPDTARLVLPAITAAGSPPDEAAPFPLPGSEMGALTALGFAKPLLDRMLERARENGTRVEAELLRSGVVREDAYYGAMARLLRLPFVDHIEPDRVQETPMLDSQLIHPTTVRILHRHRAPENAIVPQASRLAELAASLATMPLLGRDLAITTPSAIRQAVWQAGALRRARQTTHQLFDLQPRLSARIVLHGQQGFAIGMLATLLVMALLLAPEPTLLLLHITLSHLYLTTMLLRAIALRRGRTRAQSVALPEPAGPLPRYTVMVALYREAAVAEQLIKSLERLDWPRSLLDIKLVCEADDRDTIEALRAQRPGPHFEIVEVPDYGPRTKPKALSYALVGARGKYLAIYDAEDRPHPQQLREAYRRFEASDPQVACLQAPLIITNAKASWISALFSLEYSALFRGLLPMLGKAHLPLPLGGTSNHFRTDILKASGGWDPYNVTEDADLGLRLYRMGYRSDVLRCQTLEDAPTRLRVWMGQRSRWFKGWLQTWLVLMRQPRALAREMGLVPFMIVQLMIAGMLVSALLHPLIYVFLAIGMAALLQAPAMDLPPMTLFLVTVDTLNIFGGYLLLLGLGLKQMTEHERRLVGHRWAAVPVYWIAASVAAWRAVIELKTKPFFWNKTPHAPSSAGATGTATATATATATGEHLPAPNVHRKRGIWRISCRLTTDTGRASQSPAH